MNESETSSLGPSDHRGADPTETGPAARPRIGAYGGALIASLVAGAIVVVGLIAFNPWRGGESAAQQPSCHPPFCPTSAPTTVESDVVEPQATVGSVDLTQAFTEEFRSSTGD